MNTDALELALALMDNKQRKRFDAEYLKTKKLLDEVNKGLTCVKVVGFYLWCMRWAYGV